MLHPLRFSFSLSPFCLFLPSFFTPFFFSCVYIYPMLCPLLRSCNAICLPYSTLIPSLIFGLKFILCCVLVLTAPLSLPCLHSCSVCHGSAELSGVSAAWSVWCGQWPRSQGHAKHCGSSQIHASSGKFADSVLSSCFFCPHEYVMIQDVPGFVVTVICE